jgi:opacity protein-like surface antigen
VIRASNLQHATARRKRALGFVSSGELFMKTGIAAAVLLALSAGSAYAQSPENDEGLYLGLGYGQFNVQIDEFDDTDNAVERIDDDDNAWKAFVGWRINPYFAFEINYVDLGNPQDELESSGSEGDYQVGLSGIQPAVYGTFPLGPVELFGKVGYYFYDIDWDIDVDLDNPDFDSDTSEEALSYGFGIGATVLDRLNLKLEYEKIDGDIENANFRGEDLDAIWASGAWRF